MQTNQTLQSSSEKEKEVYVKPNIEIIEMEIEGILCGSGDIPLFPGEEW